MLKKQHKTAAIILCGGKGTRLGSLGSKTNKTLLKYKNKPLIFHIIKHLEKHKIQDVVIPLGFKGNSIKKFLKNNFNNKKLKYFDAGVNTNITNRIQKSIKFINDDIRNIIILNGDSFYKFNLKKLINPKLQKKFFINLICTKLRLDYGFVIRKNNKISFNYKNQQFKKFIDINNNLQYFYSGICSIDKNFLLKNLSKIKDNFEIGLFNLAAKKNKLYFIYDDNSYFQINYNKDLIILNEKKK